MRAFVYVLLAIAPFGCGSDGGTDPTTSVTSLTISQQSATLVPGATVTLVATPRNASGDPVAATVTWTSSDLPKASVGSDGTVLGASPGVVTITATSNSQTVSATITVKEGAVVGAGGGAATGLNGSVSLTIPAGSVASNTVFTIENAPSPPASGRLVPGTAVELGPSGQSFAAPVQVSIRYSAQVPGSAPEALVALHKAVAGAWQPVAGSQVNLATKTVSANVNSFSTYAVLAGDPCLPSGWPAIAVGQTVNQSLTSSDCLQTDGSWSDFYAMTLTQATTVRINMASAAFDTFLLLVAIVGEEIFLVAFDDDAGGGTNSQITSSLPPGTYAILANSFEPNQLGAYSLSVLAVAGDSQARSADLRAPLAGGLRNLLSGAKKNK